MVKEELNQNDHKVLEIAMAVAFAAGFLLYVFVLQTSTLHMSKITKNICGGALVPLFSIIGICSLHSYGSHILSCNGPSGGGS